MYFTQIEYQSKCISTKVNYIYIYSSHSLKRECVYIYIHTLFSPPLFQLFKPYLPEIIDMNGFNVCTVCKSNLNLVGLFCKSPLPLIVPTEQYVRPSDLQITGDEYPSNWNYICGTKGFVPAKPSISKGNVYFFYLKLKLRSKLFWMWTIPNWVYALLHYNYNSKGILLQWSIINVFNKIGQRRQVVRDSHHKQTGNIKLCQSANREVKVVVYIIQCTVN